MKFTDVMRSRALTLLALLTACSGTAKDCTTIGCTNRVIVRAPTGVEVISAGTLTVCVENDCEETRFDTGAGVDAAEVALPEIDAGDVATALLVMPDGTRYEDEVKAERIQPNGPGCDPVCVDAAGQ